MSLPGWYERVSRRMSDEMPAFIHYLLEEFELPEHLKDEKQRFPTTSYKEPVVMAEIAQGSPESYIMHRIDNDAMHALFLGETNMGFENDEEETDGKPTLSPWFGTADEMHDILSSAGTRTSQNRFMKACPSPRILLSQLRNIEKTNADRVAYSKRSAEHANKRRGKEYWVLFPPVSEMPTLDSLL